MDRTSGVLAIEAQGLGKAYRRYPSAGARGVELLSLGRLRRHEDFWALRGIDLELARGCALGLIGANGAGKSTLLRMLAQTTRPSEGRFRVGGRVASLLELGAGFHLDFTGRENLQLCGLLSGLTRAEVRAKEAAILEFAELGDFIDQPVRTYSSGMGLRLGFAIASAIEPEVLLIDEVFAVGDMYFQKKCVDRVLDFKRAGGTIVLCSHSLYDVRQMCDQALWLERGRARAFGDAVSVTNDYATFQREHIEAEQRSGPRQARELETLRSQELPRIVRARAFRAGTDEEVGEVQCGEALEVRIEWENPHPARHPIHLGVGFLRQDRTLCSAAATHLDGLELRGAAGCARLCVPELPLLAGQFAVLVVLFDGEGVHRYQELVVPQPLSVRARTKELGLFRMPHHWRLDGDGA
jgi:ABC-type polysaccharide/polyol phosphate transport system ATPase subunit